MACSLIVSQGDSLLQEKENPERNTEKETITEVK